MDKLKEILIGASAAVTVAAVCALPTDPAPSAARPSRDSGYLQVERVGPGDLQVELIESGVPVEPASPGACACGDHKPQQTVEPPAPQPPPRRAGPCECPEGCPCAHCSGKSRDCFCVGQRTFAEKGETPKSRGMIDRMKNLFGGNDRKATPKPEAPTRESLPQPGTRRAGPCECPEGCPCAHCSGKQRGCTCKQR